jgi:hypothetical protein
MNILLPAAAAKDGRIEELVQQHHVDRVKMHELHEKTSSFDTELAGLRSQLSHEQAHRQRLEARLRQLMSTPDFAAEGLGGTVLLCGFNALLVHYEPLTHARHLEAHTSASHLDYILSLTLCGVVSQVETPASCPRAVTAAAAIARQPLHSRRGPVQGRPPATTRTATTRGTMITRMTYRTRTPWGATRT